MTLSLTVTAKSDVVRSRARAPLLGRDLCRPPRAAITEFNVGDRGLCLGGHDRSLSQLGF